MKLSHIPAFILSALIGVSPVIAAEAAPATSRDTPSGANLSSPTLKNTANNL